MKPQTKQEILSILEQHRQLLGVDKERIEGLIKEMRFIVVTHEAGEGAEAEIENYAIKCAGLIGYDITTESSRSNKTPLPSKRQAIIVAVYDKFGDLSYIQNVLAKTLKKHRTSITAARDWGRAYANSGDRNFLDQYSRLTTELIKC